MATDAQPDQPDQPDFSALLRRARRAAGLTQEELADRADISARGISDIERGVIRAPRMDTLDLLADALGLSVRERANWEQARKRLSARSAPPAATATAHRSTVHLPTPLTTFIGREQEVASITAMLRDPDVRLLTLTGPGGVGKTRLAIVAADTVRHDFPDGVVFVNLAPLGSPDLVIPTIAATLNLQERGGLPFLDVLIDYLAQRRVLLLLDNVEHVLEASQAIARLLSAAPSLTALATSRIALRLSGEHLYDVPSLDLPDPLRLPDLERTARYESVRLFLERARQVLPDFEITDANAAPVTRICHRLDGLPLAIELAAGRVRGLPPAVLLQRLEHRLPLLTGGPRDLPARQQTLRGAIAWSHDLLPDDERRLFGRLSVFRGGWTLEAAEAVAGDDQMLDVLDGLERLVEHSLIRVQPQPDGTARYSILETIREFGLEQLAAAGEADDTHQRHAEYFATVAERGDEALSWRPEGAASDEWIDRLATEHDNFRAALTWAKDTNNPDQGFHLVGLLWYFLMTAGHYAEGRVWTDTFLPFAEVVPSRSYMRALSVSGLDAHFRGDTAEGVRRLEEALGLARSVGADDMAAPALGFLGIAAAERPDPDLDAAGALFEQARALARPIGLWRVVIGSTVNLGFTARLTGQPDRAIALTQEALTLARETDDGLFMIAPLTNLGGFALERGDLSGADASYREALGLPGIDLFVLESIQLIEGFAMVTQAQGALDIAVRLIGAATSARESADYTIMAGHQAEHRTAVELTLRDARERLNEASFAEAWNEGVAMSLEQAIDYARALTGHDDDVPTR